jgi:hypothetical protein
MTTRRRRLRERQEIREKVLGAARELFASPLKFPTIIACCS